MAKLSEPALTAADHAHWAFHKPIRPELPHIRDTSWLRTAVDAFVLAGLEQAGLPPAPVADRRTLLRRVSLDLIGLPPTPEQVEQFLQDTRPDAYVHVVDRLLASPHYGERWAQHWLDVVRYAESNGYEGDAERPHAWRYRDYVIGAFNADKPFNQFVIEQLAGDELARGHDPRAFASALVAAGFNRCGQIHVVSGNTDPDINRQEVLTEMTTGVAAAFLGLTIGCARCHDHKFDPISQADYYRLQAFFAAAQPREEPLATAQEKTAHDSRVQQLEAQLAPLRKQVADLETPYRNLLTDIKKALLEPAYREALDIEPAKRTPEQKQRVEHAQILIKVTWDEIVEALSPAERARRAEWRAQIHALEGQLPPPPAAAWTLTDHAPIPPTHVLKRGDPKRKGADVQPAFPRILATGSAPHSERLQRLDLARWLTRPDHPLTARVLVNRLWQHHLGRGLVATPNDFGLHGAKPTHPELLDWLACELMAHDWSVKHVHRLIVLSNTYQQASRTAAEVSKRMDPGNRLLGHQNRQRLEGEVLRDSILAVAGTLNRRLEGPMVRVPLEPEVTELIFTEGEPDGLWLPTPDRREHCRRSIYLFAKRNLRLPLLEAFDRPDLITSCPVRPISTFAPQALIMLNGPFLQEQSRALAVRLATEAGADPDRQIERAYHLALGRPPRAVERQMARDFITTQANLLQPRHANGATTALADFCLALFNSNEFLYAN
jgi:hypothetical protein